MHSPNAPDRWDEVHATYSQQAVSDRYVAILAVVRLTQLVLAAVPVGTCLLLGFVPGIMGLLTWGLLLPVELAGGRRLYAQVCNEWQQGRIDARGYLSHSRQARMWQQLEARTRGTWT